MHDVLEQPRSHHVGGLFGQNAAFAVATAAESPFAVVGFVIVFVGESVGGGDEVVEFGLGGGGGRGIQRR